MDEDVRLHQTVITTRNLSRTMAFYATVMGLQKLTSDTDHWGSVCLAAGEAGSATRSLCFSLEARNPEGGTDLRPLNGIVFATAPGDLSIWAERLARAGARISGRAWSFQKEHLCFSDPDAFDLAMIEEPQSAGSERSGGAPQCWLRGVELQVHAELDRVRALLRLLGYQSRGQEGCADRFELGLSDVRIDLLNLPNTSSRFSGAGRLDRLVFKVGDLLVLDRLASGVEKLGFLVRTAPHSVTFDLNPLCDLEIQLSC